jgi:hypothetical protein
MRNQLWLSWSRICDDLSVNILFPSPQKLLLGKPLTIHILFSLRMTITIIGSGKAGASVALNCGIRDLDDLLLIDIIQGLPQGEAMDINHQLSEMGIDRLVRGNNNYADMSSSDIAVLVAGIGRKPGMTRMDLLQTNANTLLY